MRLPSRIGSPYGFNTSWVSTGTCSAFPLCAASSMARSVSARMALRVSGAASCSLIWSAVSVCGLGALAASALIASAKSSGSAASP